MGAGPEMSVTQAPFGTAPGGEAVQVYTLANGRGIELRAATYGGIIVSLQAPDRAGRPADVVLGYDALDGYRNDAQYFGAIVGRYANRIARARFALDGQTYTLAANDGRNHLHGGRLGFNRVVWAAEPFRSVEHVGLVLRYESRDGEEGYPGTLRTRVTYTLTDRDELAVDYLATTDRATPVNLTQHSYFNLAGAGAGDVLDHQLRIFAEAFTPVDETMIPTGAVVAVAGGPFDFRTPLPIGARIDAADEQLRRGQGYDHNFVLHRGGTGPAHAARVVEPVSGRTLDVYTTEPGLQLYSGNHIGERTVGKGGRVYGPRGGFCLETQHYPDSPNQAGFPSTILRPGQELHSRTVFAFGVTG
jgi:aldose 1-epimerase